METQEPLILSRDWNLVANNVDYVATVGVGATAEFYAHTSAVTPPVASAEGHPIKQGDGIHSQLMSGIIWSRSIKINIPAKVVVTR